MQIDFHDTATYAVARIAGLSPEAAEIVAHAAQYVDDSTTSGFLRFQNGMRVRRDATAHPMLDPNNLDNDESALSWLPFHFLPGNEIAATYRDNYLSRLVCRQDSPIARQMMAAAISAKDKPHALHRLGIAAHVFVDTFAHKGFIGQHHEANGASNLRDASGNVINVVPVPTIGHGQVGTCPDRPFLVWSYMNAFGERIQRSNPQDFLLAADRLCQEFRRFALGDPDAVVDGLADDQKALFSKLFADFTSEDGDVRHKQWLEALRSDYFGFGAVELYYIGKGAGSWKHKALGNAYLDWEAAVKEADANNSDRHSVFQQIGALISDFGHRAEALQEHLGVEPMNYPYTDEFFESDYKLFHDAASDQRYDIFRKILPAFGIYAA